MYAIHFLEPRRSVPYHLEIQKEKENMPFAIIVT